MWSFYVRHLSRINRGSILLSRRAKISICNKVQPFSISRSVYDSLQHKSNESDNVNTSRETNGGNIDRVTFSSLSRLIKNEPDSSTFTEEQVTLFLKCCGKFSIYATPENRMEMLNTLWSLLETNGFKFNIEHYNTFIQMCTENRIRIDCDNFLAKMQTEPQHETYKLLLQNVCERGDVDQSFSLLSLMKEKGYIADEETFNFLVLAHTIHTGLGGGEDIFNMMKSAQIPFSDDTKFSLIRGLIINGSQEDFKTALQKYPLILDEEKFLIALEDSCSNNKHLWLQKLIQMATMESFSRQFPMRVETLCVHLIHLKQYDAPLYVYKNLVKPTPDSYYAKELIKHMVRTKAPVAEILSVVMDLKESELNSLALENAAEVALRTEYLELIWSLFKKFTCLRPHFFWPVLVAMGRKDGELGILATLEEMNSLGVKADAETFENYCFRFCNLSEPQLLLTKLQSLGYTVKETLTSVLVVLLLQGELQKAHDLSRAYNVQIFGERLVPVLVNNWKNGYDVEAIASILQKACETSLSNVQHLEIFLNKIFYSAKSSDDVKRLVATLTQMKSRKLYINPFVADNLINVTNRKFLDDEFYSQLRDAVDAMQDVSITEEPTILPHPRDMNLDQLECHLLELESKNMETRGVLRKLIQLHANAGNHRRAGELREKFISHGYTESPGMKSSIMHNYVQSKDFPSALDIYQEIKLLHPHFKLDSFKIVNLAKLGVETGEVEEAIKILEEGAKRGCVVGGRGVENNCVRLLRAGRDANEVNKLFRTLLTCGYCKASNIMLGPLVQIHLKNDDLEKAVQVFTECTDKYKATPFQLEVLRAVLKAQRTELFQKVVDATQRVHGKPGVCMAVISVLAEEGMQEVLKKFLTNSAVSVRTEMVHKRCDRWVTEKKLVALKTLASVLLKVPVDAADLPYVYLSIMRLHSLNNDCNSALEFWEELVNEKVFISKEVGAVLCSLLKQNNYDVPKNLEAHM